MIQESCESKKGRAINQASSASRGVRLKPDDRLGVESHYIRDSNLTLTVVGPSFLMKKKVIDKTLTCCPHSFFYQLDGFSSRDLLL